MDQQSATKADNTSNEDEIQELAKKELLRDIKCAAMRAEQFGAHSWAKPQKYVPSKRFLQHMLVSASKDNIRKNEKLKINRAKVTSSIGYQSKKHERASSRVGKVPHKHSRWDSDTYDISSKNSKSNTNHRNKGKEIRKHHGHDKRAKKKT